MCCPHARAQARTKYGSLLLEGGYGGAFILGLTPQDAYMRALAGTGTPTVLLDNCVPNASVGYVGTDSWEGVELGVRHLAGLGHRKIAFLNGTRDSMVSEERRLAFLHATWLCGLSADERMMAYGYYEQNCAREYVPHFLAQGATAILCASDGIARWVLAELRRLGLRVPGDVSVMGYDDLPLAAGCEPPLTTIRQDRLALGKSAFSLLDSLMNGVAVSKVLLRPQLIVRESTGLRLYGNRPAKKQKRRSAAIPAVESAFFCASPPAGMRQRAARMAASGRARRAPLRFGPQQCARPPLPPQPIRCPFPPARTPRRTRGSPAAGRKAAPAPVRYAPAPRASVPARYPHRTRRSGQARPDMRPAPPAQRVYL